jgi:DNA replication licensing factor MCM4
MDIRKRGFAGTQMKRPIFNATQQIESGENIISQSSDNIQSHQVLWGTNINVSDISSRFRYFLSNFRTREDEIKGGDNFYVRQLAEIQQTNIYLLNIDANHLNSFDRQIYITLINYPSEMIPIMDNVTTIFYQEYCSQFNAEINPNIYIQVRINNLTSKSRIRDLGPQDIDKLISITGITIRNSEIIPEMREAFFKCAVCGKTEVSLLTRSKIVEPNECKSCKSKFSFDLIHNRSVYTDKQHVKLQETPEHMPEGETPLTVHLCCYDELVDFVKPGDRCEVVGIFRAHGLRVNPKQRVTKSIYRTYIDVVSFTKQNKQKLNNAEQEDDANGNDLNEDFKEEVQKEVDNLKKHPDIYNILVDSFAPSIWENEDIKKGLLLQIFGGVSKDFRDSGRGKFRGDINVLLVGDPSTAKSQLLQYVHNLAPRGIYTSGKVNLF